MYEAERCQWTQHWNYASQYKCRVLEDRMVVDIQLTDHVGNDSKEKEYREARLIRESLKRLLLKVAFQNV